MAINYTNYGSAELSTEAGVIDKQQRCIQSLGGGVEVFLGREVAPGICFSSVLTPLLPKLQSIQLRSISGRARRSDWPWIHKMWLRKKIGRTFGSMLAPVLGSFGTKEKLEKRKQESAASTKFNSRQARVPRPIGSWRSMYSP